MEKNSSKDQTLSKRIPSKDAQHLSNMEFVEYIVDSLRKDDNPGDDQDVPISFSRSQSLPAPRHMSAFGADDLEGTSSAEFAPTVPRRRRSRVQQDQADDASYVSIASILSTASSRNASVRGMKRSSSATTFGEEEQKFLSPRVPPRRSASALILSSDVLRDVQPALPRRRRSSQEEKISATVGAAISDLSLDEDLESEDEHEDEHGPSTPSRHLSLTSRRSGAPIPKNISPPTSLEIKTRRGNAPNPTNSPLDSTRKSVHTTTSASTQMTPEELESYVLARIPGSLKEQLQADEWKKVFTVVAHSASGSSQGTKSRSFGNSERSGSVVDKVPGADENQVKTSRPARLATFATESASPSEYLCIDGDDASCVSAITEPMLFGTSSDDRRSLFDDDESTTDSPTQRSRAKLAPSIPSRTWHAESLRGVLQTPKRQSSNIRSSSLPLEEPLIKEQSRRSCLRSSSDIAPNEVRSQKNRVKFDTVQIRHYETVLVCNPCTSSGPSVGIGWRFIEGLPHKLGHSHGRRRHLNELIVPRHVRERWLREVGYSDREIASAVRKSLKAKNQRKQTVNNLHVQTIEYMVEKSRRKVGRLLRFSKKSSQF